MSPCFLSISSRPNPTPPPRCHRPLGRGLRLLHGQGRGPGGAAGQGARAFPNMPRAGGGGAAIPNGCGWAGSKQGRGGGDMRRAFAARPAAAEAAMSSPLPTPAHHPPAGALSSGQGALRRADPARPAAACAARRSARCAAAAVAAPPAASSSTPSPSSAVPAPRASGACPHPPPPLPTPNHCLPHCLPPIPARADLRRRGVHPRHPHPGRDGGDQGAAGSG